jgi:hypothetical protein
MGGTLLASKAAPVPGGRNTTQSKNKLDPGEKGEIVLCYSVGLWIPMFSKGRSVGAKYELWHTPRIPWGFLFNREVHDPQLISGCRDETFRAVLRTPSCSSVLPKNEG